MDRSEKTRLDDLEILASHQAQMLEDLNEAVIEQGKMISDLRRKIEVATSRISEFEADGQSASPNQKPPHW